METYKALSIRFLSLATILLISISVGRSQIIENDYSGNNTAYSFPTANDLLYGATALSFTNGNGSFTDETSAGLAALTDGTYGATSGSNANAFSAMGGPNGGTSATYSLGSNLAGYTLTDIEVYSGWNDSGRYQQAYTISYSLVSNPTSFQTLYTVNPYPAGAYTNGDTDNAAETQLTSATGTLVTGVADVDITFNNVVNAYTGYREFVVNGTPTAVPEPSIYALLGIGIALLLGVQRFRPRV